MTRKVSPGVIEMLIKKTGGKIITPRETVTESLRAMEIIHNSQQNQTMGPVDALTCGVCA